MHSEASNAAVRGSVRRTAVDRAIVRSGGAIAFVVLLSWMAGSGASRSAFEPEATRASAPAPAFATRAAEHRKQLFDERRSRFDEARRARHARVTARADGRQQ